MSQTDTSWRIGSAMQALDSYSTEIARQRSRLKAGWESLTTEVEQTQERLRAVEATLAHRESALTELLGQHRDFEYAGSVGVGYGGDPDEVLDRRDNGNWRVSRSIEDALDSEMQRARSELWEASRKSFGFRARNRATAHLAEYERTLIDLREAKERLGAELSGARAKRTADARSRREAAEEALAPTAALAAEATRHLPPHMQRWASEVWKQWSPTSSASSANVLYAGRLTPTPDPALGDNEDFGCSAEVPIHVDLGQNLHLVHDGDFRNATLGLVRSLVIRSLAAHPPGKLQCTLFDPTGLGQSVAELLELAEYDSTLIGGKVWSAPSDILARLNEHTAHIELVIQKYLRSSYNSIDEFNAAAGEIEEPYRLLVVIDFPTSFTEESFQQLRRIVENGPRCGVRTLLVSNTDLPTPYGVDPGLLPQPLRRIATAAPFGNEHAGYSHQLRYSPDTDSAAAPDITHAIVEGVGRGSAHRAVASIGFTKLFELFKDAARRGVRPDLPLVEEIDADDPASWWRASTTFGISAPIGLRGARDVATLTFDSGDHAGALLVGRPGSGKSTLLHTFLSGVTTLYAPDELDLYLIDFKEGVEFKMYASQDLPHARCVAIESDREFGLSVLQSLEAELTRRGQLLRATGGKHSGLEGLRQATQEKLPRVLLVFDEFHVLFSRNDKIGLAAADLLELLIRQGRSFGMHVLLGSQSLSGLDALGAHVPQLLPVRILLPAAEADARRVLGDGNDGGQYLTHHGEGILNPAGGAVEANERFKGALVPEEERIRRLELLRAKADREGHLRRPLVFEGNAAASIEATPPAQFLEETKSTGRAPIRLRVGMPMSIHGTADLELRREAGANVLVVARDNGGEGVVVDRGRSVPHGLVLAALASAASSLATLDLVDFTPIDDGLDDLLAPFVDAGRVNLIRRRQLRGTVDARLEQVRSRIIEDDASGPPSILFLFGLHRARDLEAIAGGFDGDERLADALEELVRDGPEVGFHVWVWADTVATLGRRLPSSALREFSWRLAGRMSADDSQVLLGTEAAGDLRNFQFMVVNDDIGVAKRCTSYAAPGAQWLRDLVMTSKGSTSDG